MDKEAVIQSVPFGDREGKVYQTIESMGRAAADQAVSIILETLETKPVARIMIGTGNSQETTIAALTADPRLDWSRIEVFHMDEYVGIADAHSASFRKWLRSRVEAVAHPRTMHYIAGDAPDIQAELDRYTALLHEAPLDMTFIGFGENGHIAFNDPHVADFEDPLTLKIVDLDETCRRQQVGEGHFPDLNHVPTHAVTVTCSGLFRAEHWVVVVPELRKATAVKQALEGPISPDCPGSLSRQHPRAWLFLDHDSASLLSA